MIYLAKLPLRDGDIDMFTTTNKSLLKKLLKDIYFIKKDTKSRRKAWDTKKRNGTTFNALCPYPCSVFLLRECHLLALREISLR